MRLGMPGLLEVRVGLRQQHQARELLLHDHAFGLIDPRGDGCHALSILGIHGRCAAEVVVAALHIERDEQHAAGLPAHVLAIGGMRPGLPLHRHAPSAQAVRARREQLAELGQAIHRVHAAAMAVGPVVVSGDEDERVADAVELRLARLEPGIGARAATGGDVADVDDEGQLLAVELVDERVELDDLGGVVGRVAQHGEGTAAVRRAGQGRGAAREQGEGQRKEDGAKP